MSDIVKQFRRQKKYWVGGPLYNPSELGDLLDKMGNPVVVTTGFQEILPQNVQYVESTYMIPYAKKKRLSKNGKLYK